MLENQHRRTKLTEAASLQLDRSLKEQIQCCESSKNKLGSPLEEQILMEESPKSFIGASLLR
jgi:hypothetical protein